MNEIEQIRIKIGGTIFVSQSLFVILFLFGIIYRYDTRVYISMTVDRWLDDLIPAFGLIV